jgi:hypothetical protein
MLSKALLGEGVDVLDFGLRAGGLPREDDVSDSGELAFRYATRMG